MKKFPFLLIAAAFFAIWVASCSKNHEDARPSSPADEARLQGSAIAQREKEIGAKLATQDVTITDEVGLNKVVIRFAAREESTLRDYLANTRYSLTPVTSKAELGKGLKSAQSIGKQGGLAGPSLPDDELFIMTEEVSRALEPGAIGYVIRVKANSKPGKNGRVAYMNFTEHVSPAWCETGYIECNYRSVKVYLDFKDRWYTGWYLWATVDPLNAGYFWAPNIDGPYKARFGVEYDYSGDYSYAWICD